MNFPLRIKQDEPNRKTRNLGNRARWIGLPGIYQAWPNKGLFGRNAKASQERNTVIPVVTGKAEMATMAGDFSVVGNCAPYKKVAVMAETAGKILTLNFDNGTTVQAGATLATVDNELLRIQMETTKTNLAKAENDFSRLQKLLGEGGVTQQQIDDVKIQIENLKQQIKGSEKQISMSYVKAPISGVVTNKMVEKGSLIAPAMQLAMITDIQSPENAGLPHRRAGGDGEKRTAHRHES